jgi:hypothetical protein
MMIANLSIGLVGELPLVLDGGFIVLSSNSNLSLEPIKNRGLFVTCRVLLFNVSTTKTR